MNNGKSERLKDIDIMHCILHVLEQTCDDINDYEFGEFYKKLAFFTDKDAVSTTWDVQYSKHHIDINTRITRFKSGYPDNYVSVYYKNKPMLEIAWGYHRSALLNTCTEREIYMYSAGEFEKQKVLVESLDSKAASLYGKFEYVEYKDEETNLILKSCRKMIVNRIRNALNSVQWNSGEKEETVKMDRETSITNSSPKCLTETEEDINKISDTIRVFKKDAFRTGCAYHIIVHEDEGLQHIQFSRFHFPTNEPFDNATAALVDTLKFGRDCLFLYMSETREKAWFTTTIEDKAHGNFAVIEFAIKSSIISDIDSSIAAGVVPPISIWELKHK